MDWGRVARYKRRANPNRDSQAPNPHLFLTPQRPHSSPTSSSWTPDLQTRLVKSSPGRGGRRHHLRAVRSQPVSQLPVRTRPLERFHRQHASTCPSHVQSLLVTHPGFLSSSIPSRHSPSSGASPTSRRSLVRCHPSCGTSLSAFFTMPHGVQRGEGITMGMEDGQQRRLQKS
ncbi:hypothetical protein FA13DRAFT_725835 [Coprinellus micaceus]|uniref:Uncharacterized protein n=1 Tax=Coprinellus micaceus TaxID=71717 RepID=A0A4Y7TX44_COPMI|nr:hypothetical protein FA13DRAFT_725835 [Coprinellus micaceus]